MSGIPIHTLSAINQFTASSSEIQTTKARTTHSSAVVDDSNSKLTPIPSFITLPPRKQSLQPKNYPPTTRPPPSAPSAPLGHPPGYQQNIYAAEPNHEVRRAMEVAACMEQHDMDDGSQARIVWNTTKNWAASTGEILLETEKTVWRRMSRT
ncbi:hypothetical protein K3495_g2423 [Podosphaera aphanis]|nr:hypothetical protein K3495_g2423 [Podosphaera aphanis]